MSNDIYTKQGNIEGILLPPTWKRSKGVIPSFYYMFLRNQILQRRVILILIFQKTDTNQYLLSICGIPINLYLSLLFCPRNYCLF